MKNRILTNSLRSIKKNFFRFLSLLLMSLLGVFVFSGLLSTAPDMLATLDTFLDSHDLYDLQVISTMGLTEDDLEYLKTIEGVEEVEGSYAVDIVMKNEDSDRVIQLISLPTEINKIDLLQGKLPENENEIVVEKNMLKEQNYKLGDKVSLEHTYLKSKTYEIVGVIDSPLFYNNTDMNASRGTTTVGTGTINYYAYVSRESFDIKEYTSIYIKVKDAKNLKTSSNSYVKRIEEVASKLEEKKGEREEIRYSAIYKEAEETISKNQDKMNQEFKKVEQELNTSNQQLETARTELYNAKKTLDSTKSQLDSAAKIISEQKKKLTNALSALGLTKSTLVDTINELEKTKKSLETTLSGIDPTSEIGKQINTKLEIIKNQLKNLKTLENSLTLLEQSEKDYETNKRKYEQGLNTYYQNYELYEKNTQKYQEGVLEFQKKKQDALKEIEEAQAKLNNIAKPKWFINDRTAYSTYGEYVDDTTSIQNLATVFPVVFFAVSILVSLISMNRMVEDDRSEIGTLKSLGFSNYKIMNKYLVFSFLAVLIGSILGFLGGSIFIPTIIFNIYGMLFQIPSFQIEWHIGIALLGFFIALICVCGTTILTALKVLKEKPASLMRPKAPKKGKRVFLEHIPFIWNHLNFSNKVTIRNLFRYKKRVLVTIGGIASCTALILCGFGIKDSISNLTSMQFDKTFLFDGMAYLNEMSKEKQAEIFNQPYIDSFVPTQNINGTIDNTETTFMIVENLEDLDQIIEIDLVEGDQNLSLGQVMITDKLADLKGIKVGDTIKAWDKTQEYTLTVGAIVHNYVGHYLYFTKETYESFENDYISNVVYFHTKNLNSEEESNLKTKILKYDEVLNVTFINTMKTRISNMLNSLDKVVVILIILASSLAFVVLYNLSNINISERKREIATLKVLGFYHQEVDGYITKETIIFTVLGILLGLGLGVILTGVVINTVEMESIRFVHQIKISSYIYSALISILFTLIVNVVTHFSLKKIDMIESLKSVE